MPENNQASDEARQGADSDAEGSSGQDQKQGGQWVPYERFAEATGRLKQQIEDLRDQLKTTVKGNESTGQHKVSTRAELQAEVTAGKLTAQQAAEIWDQQLEDRAAAKAVNAVSQQSQETVLRSSVRAYEAAIPELQDSDSPQFRKLQSEHRHLVKELGLPDVPATMLAALRASFGPVETLKPISRKEAEPFSETGGSGDVGGGVSDKALKGLSLSPEQKKHYSKLIDAGQLGGWEDVAKELKAYTPKNKRTREFWRK